MRLFNISNHTAGKWSDKQKKAVVEMGFDGIIDIPFPQIPADFNGKKREALYWSLWQGIAESIYMHQEIHNLSDEQITVHLTGEAGFVDWILCHSDYQFIYSTTERLVEEKGGKKISTFNFVSFEEYETPKMIDKIRKEMKDDIENLKKALAEEKTRVAKLKAVIKENLHHCNHRYEVPDDCVPIYHTYDYEGIDHYYYIKKWRPKHWKPQELDNLD